MSDSTKAADEIRYGAVTATGDRGPIDGVRALELACIPAGPRAGQLLADLGADVIKVERPGADDDTRHRGPPFLRAEDGADLGAACFHSRHRGKRSVAIDIATAEGQARVRELAAGADMVVENYTVGGPARYGLDGTTLRADNPSLPAQRQDAVWRPRPRGATSGPAEAA